MGEKKLLFYINTLGKGGAERVICQLANRFSGEGYEVTLATSFPVEGEYEVSERVRRISLEKEELRQSRLIRNITRIRKLRQLCKEWKPDGMVAFMQEPNFRAILATIGLPVKTIVSVRNDPNREYAGKIGRFVGKHIMPLADGCIFQTEEAKQWFPKKLQDKSTIIMNEVSDSFFEVQRKPSLNVVTVGRLAEQKNQCMLIRAFAKIAQKFPGQNLLIYGSGDYAERLKREINILHMENRAFLMGSTSRVQEVLAQAGVFVLSSDYEGMPNALMEALAVGVPSISTDCPCGGPNVLIRHEENGLLVPVGDENALADAMDRLLSDRAFAEKLGKQARQDAKRYEPEVIFEEWKTFVDSIL